VFMNVVREDDAKIATLRAQVAELEKAGDNLADSVAVLTHVGGDQVDSSIVEDIRKQFKAWYKLRHNE